MDATPDSVALTVHGKNGGRLLSGGMPGNKGGRSYPSATRQKLAKVGLRKATPYLEAVLSDESAPNRERLLAAEIVLRHGLSRQTITMQAVKDMAAQWWLVAEAWAAGKGLSESDVDELRTQLQVITQGFGRQHSKD